MGVTVGSVITGNIGGKSLNSNERELLNERDAQLERENIGIYSTPEAEGISVEYKPRIEM